MPLPVYVINLPRDAQRMTVMSRQLGELGLGFERVNAVYGRELTPAQRDELCDAALNQRLFCRPLQDGEIGCYASHLVVWQRVVDAAQPAALVLEDDITLTPDLLPVLNAIASLPPRWDMVKLIGRDVESPWRRWRLCDRVDLIRYRRAPSLTSGYVISQDGARKLLSCRRPFYRPVDVDLRHWWECGLRLYGAYPYPVLHSEAAAQSSIGSRAGRAGMLYLRYRLRRVRDELRYSLGNWRANRRLRADNPTAA